MAEGRDPYRILQVDPGADAEVIAAAFRVLARKLHPDSGSADAARMAELNWAYGLLRDRDSRARYDRDRRLGRTEPARPPAAPTRRDGVGRSPDSGVGGARLDFGRYSGWTLREVARRDLDYLRWLSRHSSGAPLREEISALLWELDPDAARAAHRAGRNRR